MGKIRIVLLVLLLCSTVTAGTYKKDVQLMVSGVGVDSVVAIVEINNVEQDSILWDVFPVDSFITLQDTAILNIAWFWFFSDNSGEATRYTTAYEQIPTQTVDTLSTAFVDRLTGRIADTNWEASFTARDDVVGSFGDSAQGWSTQADFTQIPGADVSLTYLALDTTTNTGIQGVSVSAYNLSDVRVAFGTTDGNGEITFGFKLNDDIYFNSTNPVNYVWVQRDTALLIQNGDLDTTEGYQFSGDAPQAGKTAAVTIFITNNDRTAAVGVAVHAYLSRSNVIDSAGYPVYNQTQTKYTDSDGKVIFTCIWSSYMIPATKWYFTTSVPGTIKKKITIPRQTTITLDLR